MGQRDPQNPARIYNQVGALHPRRSLFDLSHEIKLTCDYGQLIPVLVHDCIPGDFFELSTQAIVRTIPMVAPLMHEVNIYFHYFFTPHRVVTKWAFDAGKTTFDWESFITGGKTGSDAQSIPRWNPVNNAAQLPDPGTLWDYMGFPTGEDTKKYSNDVTQSPMIFPLWAYQLIYDQYYKDETVGATITPADPATTHNDALYLRAWEKDYFTSALTAQQRGTAPAFPVSGSTSAVWAGSTVYNGNPAQGAGAHSVASDNRIWVNGANGRDNFFAALNANAISFSSATTFNVSDMRLNIQIQKFMERNERAGYRFTEFLQSHFGVHNGDSRLQRPEYVGGTKQPILTSEVLQTSATVGGGTPQGTLAGHGISADRQFSGKYHCKEHGTLMCIMSIMPRSGYQQGMPRIWTRQTRYDFYFPEFAHLSEQAVLNQEIYYDQTDSANQTTFGFQGRYDEYRTIPSRVSGLFKSTFNYWHLNRAFASRPSLNDTFIKCDGTSASAKRIFAAGTTSPGFMVQIAHLIKAFRPLPGIAEPGLMDHF